MALAVISAKYPPHIDVTRAPLAYGDRALPRLNRELNAKELLTRQRAVRSLCDLLHDPEYVAEALRVGIVESLKELLKDPDITVRQKSTECLYVIASHAVGRQAFLEKEIIVPLSKLFDDKEDIARKNAHMAMEMASEIPSVAEGIVLAELVPVLVKKLTTELDEIKIIMLETLHFCLRVSTEDALKNMGMEILTDLLKHENPKIRGLAARDIMDLSVPLAGKDKAVEVKTVAILVKLLNDSSADVKSNAAGAIATISITTKGKYTALQQDAIPPLVELVNHSVSEVQLNALKALTCLSEAPEGRKELLKHVDKIKSKTEGPIPAVVRAAEIAVKVITWKP